MALVTMRDIKRKIRSIRNIQTTTRAMMLVATAKLKKYEPQLKNLRIYKENFYQTIKNVISKAVDFTHPLLLNNQGFSNHSSVGVLILGSQRGLCGAFNSNLCKFALLNLPPNAQLIIVGKKVYDYFKKEKNIKITEEYPMPDKLTQEFLKEFTEKLLFDFFNKKYTKIICIYYKFKSAIASILTKEDILPIPLIKPTYGIEYLYEPTREEILDILLKEYIYILINSLFLESQLSEHSARMLAMQQATNNAGKLIDKLWLDFNKVRQTTITKEIADIINTTEAIRR